MLMMPDKKKMVSVILGSLSPKNRGDQPGKETVEKDDVEDDKSTALRDSMERFLRAVKAEDPGSMVSSMKDFVYLSEENEEKETSEEE